MTNILSILIPQWMPRVILGAEFWTPNAEIFDAQNGKHSEAPFIFFGRWMCLKEQQLLNREYRAI